MWEDCTRQQATQIMPIPVSYTHLDVYKRQTLDSLTMADKWILSKVNTLAKDVTENLDKYELGIALQKVYDFICSSSCGVPPKTNPQ